MHKPELSSALAEKTGMSKQQAARVLNVILDEITAALEHKEDVALIGFGSFVQRSRGARVGKNPQTGEPMQIPASKTVAFKPGKQLKEAVNC